MKELALSGWRGYAPCVAEFGGVLNGAFNARNEFSQWA